MQEEQLQLREAASVTATPAAAWGMPHVYQAQAALWWCRVSAGAWPAGSEGAIPAPADAAKSTKATGDLLRRFKEMGQSMRNDYKEPPPLDDAETNLRASPPRPGGRMWGVPPWELALQDP